MSRGYGGGEIGPLFVDPVKHTPWHTGDEPLILAAAAPTIVSGDRSQGLMLALHKRADMVLMDDGLQNPHIEKTINIVVINGNMGFGNGKMLPAGPLREPLAKGLQKADMFVLIGEDKRNVKALLPSEKPLFTAKLKAHSDLPKDTAYLAFAGIGYPEKFYSFLKDEQNLNVVETISYPDHYPYDASDIEILHKKAAEKNAQLVTTEKDFIRLPKNSAPVDVMHIELQWDDEPALLKFLKIRLAQ
jgi:tetraacyldisaccharide 4'-kinase